MTSQVYEPKGYKFHYLPADEFPSLAEHLDDSTRMVWIETPTNPLLNIVDIAAAPEAPHPAAHHQGLPRPRGGHTRGRRATRRRQHVRDAVPAAAARARR